MISTRRQILYIAVVLLATFRLLDTACGAEDDSELFYRSLETSDGLPDNSVNALAQTIDGYLWVATEGGLVRSNGTSFTEISLQKFDSVRSRSVQTIFHDSQGQLWVGMKHGPLIRISRQGGKEFTVAEGAFNQGATAITEDSRGAVWIAYPNGLCRIKDEDVTRFTQAEGLPEGDNLQIISDASKNLWFAKGKNVGVVRNGKLKIMLELKEGRVCIGAGASSGLWVCEGSSITHFEKEQRSNELARLPDDVVVKVLFEDPTGTLWIGTSTDGLFRLKDGTLTHVATSYHNVSCLNMDLEQNLRVGTLGGGLNLIRPRTIKLINKKAGLPFDSTLSVAEDSSGRIWAVGQNGRLAQHQGDGWKYFDELDGNATCVAFSKKSGLWVGTRNRGLLNFPKPPNLESGQQQRWTTADGLASDSVRSILPATNGDLWVATNSPSRLQRLSAGLWTTIKSEEKLGSMVALTESADGSIWLGTGEGQIFRVKDDSLITVSGITESKRLPLRSLHATPDGSLWIGYSGDGLGWFKEGKYARITKAEGLMDDYIAQVLADGRGALWISTNRGISQVNLNELLDVAEGRAKWVRSRAYGRSEGLPNLHPSRGHSPSACLASNGHLWFSMRNGLVVAQPDKIRDNPIPPAVLLEQVSLDDQPVALYGNRATLLLPGKEQVLDLSIPSAKLQVPPGNRKLEFFFTALSFSSPENVRFRYQLKGFDSEWIDAGTRQSATYPRLPAGEYEFQVIACNHAGVWNETGKSIKLEVAPFFWDTLWFKISAVLAALILGGGLIWLGVRRRYKKKLRKLAQMRAVEEERARIARDIHDDMGANLTRIMLLSRPNNDGSPTDEVATLPEIHASSRNLVRTMKEVVWAVNPVQDTFEALVDYLGDYAQEFLQPADIRCRLDIPNNIPKYPLSAHTRHSLLLAFKEALNNVVKHSGATEVQICLTIEDSAFTLQIEDNGISSSGTFTNGNPPSTGGNGLINMNDRLHEIGGSCDIITREKLGTIVKFNIPLNKES